MKLYTNNNSATDVAGLYLLIDNDFLSEIFRGIDVFNEFITTFEKNYLLIDPLTEFEFLRDVFEPKHRTLKKAFIARSVFFPVPSRQEIFMKLSENAMLLSIIYSHRGHNKNTKISLVDLFLGARCMLNAGSTVIITGNKKDFPSSIYDIISVINIEQNDGSIKPYSVVKFNKEKFEKCYEEIQKMESKYDKSIK